MNKKRLKGQSAMEYLMTYGWAILIIAVVLGALFSLGVFSGSTTTACIASPGYLCTNPLMTVPASNLNGISGLATLSFTMGQNTGAQIYNIQLSCAATATSAGLPNGVYAGTGNVFFPLNSGGAATNAVLFGGSMFGTNELTLVSGQQILVSNLPCFSNTGALITNSVAIGTPFSGSIWLNYTTSGPTSSPTTFGLSWVTVKMASISVKVS